MKCLLIFFHIPQGWKKNNTATYNMNRWIHEWNYYFVGFFLFFNGKVVLLQPPPNYQEAVPAGHYAGFVHSLFPLTIFPFRIIKRNELQVFFFFFFKKLIFFFTWKNVIFQSITFTHNLRPCLCANGSPNGWSASVSRAGLLCRACSHDLEASAPPRAWH